MEFLNLFLVPMIAVSIYYRRQKRKPSIDVELIGCYAGFTVMVSIITFICMKTLAVTIGFGANYNSELYTVLAALIAFVLPYIYEMYKKYMDIRCEITRKEEDDK